MSQRIWSSINPTQTSGLMLAALLDDFKDALMTGCSGTSRPANLQAGGMWVDTTSQAAPNYYWAWKFYTGSEDIEIFRISILNGFGGTLTANGTFTTQKISADTVGAILELVKNRFNDNGQTLDGDTVAELRFTGRTNTSTNPTVAYIRFTSTDDMTSSAYGGTMSFSSSPEATASIVEHFRLISGLFETVAAHKINSLQLVSQNVATAATIAQLSADKILVEMTGSTETEIQGIESDGETQHIYIHNRSSANVTIMHEDTGAAEEDRVKLPNSIDHIIVPEATACFYYCTTDERWKLRSSVSKKLSKTVETIDQYIAEWTAPEGVTKIQVKTYRPYENLFSTQASFIDAYGGMFSWGYNANGNIGDGTVVAKSSPVAVLGGLLWSGRSKNLRETKNVIASNGIMYGWGENNSSSNLGLGDVTPRSSPVAVVGPTFSYSFKDVQTFAITETGLTYAWGYNGNGELGVGDRNGKVVPTKQATSVALSRLFIGYGSGLSPSFAITRDGTAYAWGENTYGRLGVGDITGRSSPVAVVGGLKFKKILVESGGNYATVGLTTSGEIYTWGFNNAGKLGQGSSDMNFSTSSPVAVVGVAGIVFKDIIVPEISGLSYVLALDEDGNAYGWGGNTRGQLGLGDNTSRSSPVAVLGGLQFKKIVAIGDTVLALTTDGTPYCWGDNEELLLAVGDANGRSSPVAVLGGLKFNHIAVGYDFTGFYSAFGITKEGNIYSWGWNDKGSLAVGDTTPRSSPVLVVGGNGGVQNLPVGEYGIEVTPGETYDVCLAHAMSYFGDAQIGSCVEYITISYDN